MKNDPVIYRFFKRGFKDRQSPSLKNNRQRYGVIIDANLQSDGKIRQIHDQKDFTLLGLYLHIISNLDLETEEWNVRESELKSWAIGTFGVNNRYNLYERIEFLSSIGLFFFEKTGGETANKIQTTCKQDPNNMQTSHEQGINKDQTRSKQTLLEMPETLVALHATKTNQTNQTKLITPLPPKGDLGGKPPDEVLPQGFLKFWEAYPKIRRTNRAECLKIWEKQKLEAITDEILTGLSKWKLCATWIKDDGQYIKGPAVFLNNKNWQDDVQPYQPEPVTRKLSQFGHNRLHGNDILPADKRQTGSIPL